MSNRANVIQNAGQGGHLRPAVDTTAGVPATDGAGVRMMRFIGTADLNQIDPFLLLDAFSTDNPDDYIAGFPAHPHRGFETVTYMFAGQMRHKDNAGHEGVIKPGGVQWMTAGRGIIHSEMPEQRDGLMWGTQLWINLPGSEKMTAPAYQEFDAAQIPTEERPDGIEIRVLAGVTSRGTAGVVTGRPTEPLYLDVTLPRMACFRETIAPTHAAFILVVTGSISIASETGAAPSAVAAGKLAILGEGQVVEVRGTADSNRFLLVAGQRIGEPVVRGGPFVMNTEDELRQAFVDYQSGRF